MIKTIVAILLTLLTQSPAAFAMKTPTENWVRYQDYKMNLPIPKDWRIERDLYGMPITVLGPERGGERAVLSIQHTPLRNFQFNQKVIEATQSQYFTGRQEWLDQFDDSKFIEKIPYQKITKTNVDGFQIGFRYEKDGVQFEERSIQVVCRDRLYFVKTLYSSKEPASDQAVLANLVQNLNCVPITAKDGAYTPSPWQNVMKELEADVGNRWPKQNELRKADIETKAVMLESVVEFYKKFEESAGADLYSEKQMRFKDLMNAWLPTVSSAFASGNYDCFFGGWPSQYIKKNGRLTCGSPASTNPDYSKAGASCGSNQLACNPSLFGSDICISIGSAAERSQATQRCEFEFKIKGKSYDDVVKSPTFNQSLFEETVQSAQSVCGEEEYASGNYGLCSTLRNKLGIAVENKVANDDANTQNFMSGLDAKKPSNYDQAVTATFDNYADFEKRCFDDKNNFKPEVDENMDPVERDRCIQDLNSISQDMNELEQNHQQVSREIAQTESAMADVPASKSPSNQSCPECEMLAAQKAAGITTGTDPGSPTCSAAELKEVKAGKCTAATYAKTLGQMVLAIGKSLWNNVTIMAELAVEGYHVVKDKIKSGWNWLVGSKSVENKTADKAHQASKTSNGFIAQLKKDWKGTLANMAKAILAGITDFAKNDVFCAKWSGTPSFSKCLVPGNFDCMSCDTTVRGIGTLVGYAIGELLPAFLSGGLTAAGPKVAEFMKATKATGKFAKLAAEAAETFPKVAKFAKKSVAAAKASVKYVKGIGKAAEASKVGRYSAKVYAKTKLAWKKADEAIKTFKSAKFGSYRNTQAAIAKLQRKYWIARKGVAVTKAAVRTTKNIITAPVRLPNKYLVQPVVKAQQKSFEYGLKFGEKVMNTTITNTAAIRKARIIGANLPLVKYGVGLNANMNTAAREQSTQMGVAEAWTPILDKVRSGKELSNQDIQTFSKNSGLSAEQAKDEIIYGKMELLNQGEPVKLSDAEIKRYAKKEAANMGMTAEELELGLKSAIESQASVQ